MKANTLIFAGLGPLLLLSSAVGQPRFNTIYSFSDALPNGLIHVNGVFYGVTFPIDTAVGCGTVFELQPSTAPGGAWAETTVYTFPSSGMEGCYPVGTLSPGPNGVLYGATGSGTLYGGGAVYELQPPASPGGAWTESLLYSFTALSPPNGGLPNWLIQTPSGSLYVSTCCGGTYGEGGVFEFTPPASPGGAWTGTLIYSFSPGATGDITDALALGKKGVLYGANELGAAADSGTIFELSPPTSPGGAWTETTLYTFQGFADGASPNDVIPGPHGTLYGTTLGRTPASENGAGTVFQLTPPSTPGGAWTKTTLVSFGAGYNCGPDSPLILHNGNLYGAACQPGGGVVFELQPPSVTGGIWTYTALHTFTNGQSPSGHMVMGKNGTIYGTTYDLSTITGTVYEIVP